MSTSTAAGEAFVRDNFSGVAAGSNLSNSIGEVGSGWTKYLVQNDDIPTSINDNALISSEGRVYHGVGIEGAYYHALDVPPSADYRILGNITRMSTQPFGVLDLLARIDSSTSDTRYGARYSLHNTKQWELYKVVNKVGAGLGTPYVDEISVGATRAVRFDIEGSAMTLYIDGVARINATDSSITLAGRAGISIATFDIATARSTDTLGLHLDNFIVETLSSITTAVSPIPAWTARSGASSTWALGSAASTLWSTLT